MYQVERLCVKEIRAAAARGKAGLIWTINREGEKFFGEDEGRMEEGVAIN